MTLLNKPCFMLDGDNQKLGDDEWGIQYKSTTVNVDMFYRTKYNLNPIPL